MSSRIIGFRNRLKCARDQAKAVRQLEAIGGRVGYEHEWDNELDRFSQELPPGPRLLRRLIGNHMFFVPDCYILSDFTQEASLLEPLTRLPTIAAIGIVSSAVGDEISGILCKLPALRELNLYHTCLSDESLDALARIPTLLLLDVRETQVTEAGVERFRSQRPDCRISHRDMAEEHVVQ
jgi:hypothetical protein